MSQVHEVEEVLSSVAKLLTDYGPDNTDVHRVAKAVEPIALWHEEYAAWKKKCTAKEMLRRFTKEHR